MKLADIEQEALEPERAMLAAKVLQTSTPRAQMSLIMTWLGVNKSQSLERWKPFRMKSLFGVFGRNAADVEELDSI